MKLVRFISDDNRVYCGVIEDFEQQVAQIIDGDFLNDFQLIDLHKKILKYLPPVEPPNIFALGLNYLRHIQETGSHPPQNPVLFIKATTSLTAHQAPIVIPACCTDEVDYEAELAIIIGRRGKNIPAESAWEYIFGFCCANDVSARNWQINLQAKQWARGKSFDTFCPLGPVIVTADEIADVHDLKISCRLNGNLMQQSNTRDMLFKVEEIVSNLSQGMTLLPGTVILTGTPEGVGFTRQPPVFLQDGDLVEVEIEKLGVLRNAVCREEKR